MFLLYDDSLDGTIKTFVYTSLAEEWRMEVWLYLNLPHGVMNMVRLQLLSFSST